MALEFNEILCVLMFVSFIGLLFTGFPIAWVLGGLAILFTAIGVIVTEYTDLLSNSFYTIDWAYTSTVVDRMWSTMSNWTLVALPMFIFMGLMLDRSGVAYQLMLNCTKLFGGLRGGLAVTVSFIGILLAASTGIIGASVVLLALLGLPAMMKAGYKPELAAGTICSVGTLGILIPPSIMLVLMAERLALSVGDLFLGALIPGVILGCLYVAFILCYAWSVPSAAPVPENLEKITWKDVGGVAGAIIPAAGLIMAVLGSIFFGIATPTEASGIGVVGTILLALINKKFSLEMLKTVGHQTTKTTGFIFAILLGATAFSLVFRGLGGDDLIERVLTSLPFGPAGIIVVILCFTFILGFFLDWIEISLIILPLVGPVVANLGFDLVWFTVLFAVCLQTSFLTPPVGFAIFYLKGAAPEGISVDHIYRGVLPFIAIQLIGLALVFVVPSLVTWLPAQAYGN